MGKNIKKIGNTTIKSKFTDVLVARLGLKKIAMKRIRTRTVVL